MSINQSNNTFLDTDSTITDSMDYYANECPNVMNLELLPSLSSSSIKVEVGSNCSNSTNHMSNNVSSFGYFNNIINNNSHQKEAETFPSINNSMQNYPNAFRNDYSYLSNVGHVDSMGNINDAYSKNEQFAHSVQHSNLINSHNNNSNHNNNSISLESIAYQSEIQSHFPNLRASPRDAGASDRASSVQLQFPVATNNHLYPNLALQMAPLDVDTILSEELLPTPPTAIVESIKPEYAKYYDSHSSNPNLHSVFEQRATTNDNNHNLNNNSSNSISNSNRYNIGLYTNENGNSISIGDPRDMSLIRYREKRLKRMFNRVRYSLKREVSQARPRVKGRFVKSSEMDSNTSQSTATSSTLTTVANDQASTSLNFQFKNMEFSLDTTNTNTTALSDDTIANESEDEDEVGNLECMSTPTASKINPKKRRSSIFLLGTKSFLASFGKEDILSIAPRIPSSKPFKRGIQSFLSSRSAAHGDNRPESSMSTANTPSDDSRSHKEPQKIIGYDSSLKSSHQITRSCWF